MLILKCHRVLGIEESATSPTIEKAYREKLDSLYAEGTNAPDVFIEKKSEELRSAKKECLSWATATTSEKLSLRIQEKGEALMNPNVMYTSPIGLCSACVSGCCGAFGDDSCVKCVCGENSGDGCVSCANKIDIGLYIMLGLAALGGIITLIGKIAPSIGNGIKQGKQHRNEAAAIKRESLQADYNQAMKRLNNAKTDLAVVASQYDRVTAFCHFFESLGCENCRSIITTQQGPVTAARTQVYNVQIEMERIETKLRKHD